MDAKYNTILQENKHWIQLWDFTKFKHTLNLYSLQIIMIDWAFILLGHVQEYFPHKRTSIKVCWLKFRICSVNAAFGQGGVFIVPYLVRHRASVFAVSSERPPHLHRLVQTSGVRRTQAATTRSLGLIRRQPHLSLCMASKRLQLKL